MAEAGGPALLRVEVACADAGEVMILPVEVGQGATVREAVDQSGIRQRMPGVDFETNPVGIFGKLCGMDTGLRDGDRVEIYRPLIADPKEARRRRSALQNAAKK